MEAFTVVVITVIAIIFIAILLLLGGAGLGLGYFLHWLIPSIELGSGIVAGLIAVGLSAYFTVRFFSAVGTQPENDEAGEEEEIILHPILAARRFKKKRRR
jgi:membrane protein implicated in regulation of membrane protease activity